MTTLLLEPKGVLALGLALALCLSSAACSSDRAAGECERDSDCSGDRECDDGDCVERNSPHGGGSCEVCSAVLLTCAFASGHQEDISIDSSNASGCSLTFDGKPLSVDCNDGEVCFAGECASQSIDRSFTFTMPKEGAVVCEPSS